MFRKACGTLLVLTSTSSVAWADCPPRDAINLSQATVWNSPPDIASWPVTGAITQLSMRPGQSAGLSFVFPQHNTWPNYTPPGWDGPIEYTVWAAVRINGQWHTSGIIQMWRERPSTGAPILTDFAQNWVYDSRWGAMAHYQPQVGEQMGFFVSAGNARGVGTVTSVRERTNVVVVSLPAGDTGDFTFPVSCPKTVKTAMDFDGDGKADIGIYRPSTGQWWGLASSTNYSSFAAAQWGMSGDIPTPGDYDGDGRTDIAVFRPSTAEWFLLLSSTNFTEFKAYQWGNGFDIPVPGDYDGDGKTDLAVYRPSTGTWYILFSTTNFTLFSTYQWGESTDKPVPGDYDGDGKTDIAVFRPSTANWYLLLSSTNFTTYVLRQWGVSTDTLIPADYDGDGKTDIAVYRPSNGVWYILLSGANFTTFGANQWGLSGDIPVPADYDGDGKADIAVYRPAGGLWFMLLSGNNYTPFSSYQWGVPTDMPMARMP